MKRLQLHVKTKPEQPRYLFYLFSFHWRECFCDHIKSLGNFPLFAFVFWRQRQFIYPKEKEINAMCLLKIVKPVSENLKLI